MLLSDLIDSIEYLAEFYGEDCSLEVRPCSRDFSVPDMAYDVTLSLAQDPPAGTLRILAYDALDKRSLATCMPATLPATPEGWLAFLRQAEGDGEVEIVLHDRNSDDSVLLSGDLDALWRVGDEDGNELALLKFCR